MTTLWLKRMAGLIPHDSPWTLPAPIILADPRSRRAANARLAAEFRVPKTSGGPFNLFRGPFEFVAHPLLQTFNLTLARLRTGGSPEWVESVESPDSHWKMRTLSQAVKRQGLPFCPQKSIKIPEGNHETKFQSIVNLSSNDSNVTLCILVWFCPSYLELFKGCLAAWQWPFMEIHH